VCYPLAPVSEPTREGIERALMGDEAAIRGLVDALTPVIQARVTRGLRRRSGGRGRDVAQEVEDITQEVFVALFDDDGRTLRAWDPSRGLSLANFVGMVAERQVASILRTGRRSPWTEDPTADDALDHSAGASPGPELRVVSRELFATIVRRLRDELSPRGLELFYMAVVEELPVDVVCAQLGMQPDAVYAWRSRIAKRVRRIAAELDDDGAGRLAAGGAT
jgi:RNA polymerase sigma-70 factor (ECF subfamily)